MKHKGFVILRRMYHLRIVKTSSGATAVQVVYYQNRRLKIAIHVGSAHTKKELSALKETAQEWIKETAKQQALFLEKSPASSRLISLEKCEYLGVRYTFIYECLSKLLKKWGFKPSVFNLLKDLAIVRIIEPASLQRSFELIEEMFGIRHSRRDFYRRLPAFLGLKEKTEMKILQTAKKELGFDFSLVFYDVTTLYFESFDSDELRKHGFSKDGKSNQPQILIGLMVSTLGFPVAYQIFEGNKFEGHTLIPSILSFKKKHKINQLTVVADAAMLSLENLEVLKSHGLSYIVGARMSNLNQQIIKEAQAKLEKRDNAHLRIETRQGILVCDFSLKRYRKDKNEMDKQIKKAWFLLKEPSKIKRVKFISSRKNQLKLNKELIIKTERLLGIKGYFTNLTEIDDHTIIKRYHDLWQIEQTFRIAKSDLEMRPIYHFKREAIEAHILICFLSLSVCKYLELKTGKSTKATIKQLKTVTDARIFDLLSKREIVMRSKLTEEIKGILYKLKLPY